MHLNGVCNAASILVVLLRPVSAAHYDCSSFDDVKGEVQDASGYVCGTKCAADTFNCPTDVPAGASAQPQCMLQDVDRGSFCGLLCQVDSQYPNGARCRQMTTIQVGLCLYPVSFSDWAHQSTYRKFNVGFPNRAGQPASSGTISSFAIAKTYSALQSLKSKYSIDDGDADMLVLKELLSSMTASTAVAATPSGSATGSGISSALGLTSLGQSPQQGGSVMGAWRHDLSNFEGYVGDGVPGLERQLHDTAWNVEHITHQNAASALLRGIIWIGVAYLGIGGFFKYQMGAQGMELIPHASFWMEYPTMVSDGVTYSKILLGMQSSTPDILSGGVRGGGSGAFETL